MLLRFSTSDSPNSIHRKHLKEETFVKLETVSSCCAYRTAAEDKKRKIRLYLRYVSLIVSLCQAVNPPVYCLLILTVLYLISSVDKARSADCARCHRVSISGSWRQLPYITGGAKEMTSCRCRGWKRSPDRTVMTKEFLGNVRAHRGRKKNECLEALLS